MNLPEKIKQNPLQWVSDAKHQIGECSDVGTLREMQDQAKAMEIYLQNKLGRASLEHRAAAEVVILVRRRIGNLLGPPPDPATRGAMGGAGNKSCAEPAQLSRSQTRDYRALDRIDDVKFDAYLEDQRATESVPTITGALRAAKEDVDAETVRDVYPKLSGLVVGVTRYTREMVRIAKDPGEYLDEMFEVGEGAAADVYSADKLGSLRDALKSAIDDAFDAITTTVITVK